MQALCAYFDITFEHGCSENTVIFGTAPADTPTHWMQTVFFLDQPLQAEFGDIVTGAITYHRNQKNPRHLDITLEYGLGLKASMHRQEYFLQ
jgi:hypothetical protein